mmetsp:Transcript_42296/g.126573  ORF Transcript_42296/g.126573 Transcript_42296/m.126573 type:complete len:201 (+) Transcript_42296:142-744(+)
MHAVHLRDAGDEGEPGARALRALPEPVPEGAAHERGGAGRVRDAQDAPVAHDLAARRPEPGKVRVELTRTSAQGDRHVSSSLFYLTKHCAAPPKHRSEDVVPDEQAYCCPTAILDVWLVGQKLPVQVLEGPSECGLHSGLVGRHGRQLREALQKLGVEVARAEFGRHGPRFPSTGLPVEKRVQPHGSFVAEDTRLRVFEL